MASKRPLPRVRLIHWKEEETRERCAPLTAAGYACEYDALTGTDLLRVLRADPPAAFVIDLKRLPSYGREVGAALRGGKATRHVPLVFAGGEPEKVERVRALLPDAVYTPWEGISAALQLALANPPAEPVRPTPMMDRYGGTPLAKKLGIKPGAVVAVLEPPRGFGRTLGALPEGASIEEGLPARFDLAIWFVRSVDELGRGIGAIKAKGAGAAVWIAWPKKASGVRTDLTQQIIRDAGLDVGLVDYKICAIDATWSGLAFVRRKA